MEERSVIDEEMERVRIELSEERFDAGRFGKARDVFQSLCLQGRLEEFLTIPAYEELVKEEARG